MFLRRSAVLKRTCHRNFSIQSQGIPAWATVNPWETFIGGGENLCGGSWSDSSSFKVIPDPMTGADMLKLPNPPKSEVDGFIERMANCPRSGLHNPIKHPERFVHLGEVNARVAAELDKPDVEAFMAKLIQRVAPKTEAQSRGEVRLVKAWFRYFSGDTCRNLGRSFAMPGDRPGMSSQGYRWPFGGVAVITPFNFPIEICGIQTVSAMMMGNQPLTKVDQKVSIAMEQLLKLMHHCGLETTASDYIHCDGPVMEHICVQGGSRMTLFTGSQHIAERLTTALKGRVKLEDAGFDWKILGPDVGNLEYVAWQSDLDAYGYSGQKCSAQSILFAHENWVKAGIFDKIKEMASRRSLSDLSCTPVLTWTTEAMKGHVDALLTIPGAKVLFGGKELANHTIPKCYGAFEPTAVYVPYEQVADNFDLVTKELFGPFQVVTSYKEEQTDDVLATINRNPNHLTAGIVSQDHAFIEKFLGNTFVGTTYAGMRARTTAAPQQMWFGPCGDPRSAGIHTPEAIHLVWSGHREIIYDFGAISDNFEAPAAV